MSTIDWNNLMQVAQTASAALPVGGYDMVVVNCVATNAKTSGNPMFKTKLQVESGPHQGRTMTNNFNLTLDNPQALRIFFRQMSCFGLDANFFAQNPTPEQIAAMIVGRRARVDLTIEKWNGEDQNRINAISVPVGAVPQMGNAAPLPGVGAPAAAPITPPAPAFVPAPAAAVPAPAVPAPAAPIPTPQPAVTPQPTVEPQPEPIAAAPTPTPAPDPAQQFTPEQIAAAMAMLQQQQAAAAQQPPAPAAPPAVPY